ncbi:hypothetical protein [Arthrobacter sp. LAR12-1-1.1]
MIVGKSRDFATGINLLVAAQADRFVFEHPEDKIHENLAGGTVPPSLL